MQENSGKDFSELCSFSGGPKRIIKNVKFLDPRKINPDLKRKLAEAMKRPSVRQPVDKKEATESTNVSSKTNSPSKGIQVISVEQINKSNIFDDAETIREKEVSSVDQEPKHDSAAPHKLQMEDTSVSLSQRSVALPSVITDKCVTKCSQVISSDIATTGKCESVHKIPEEPSSTEAKKNIDVKNILNAKLKLKLVQTKSSNENEVVTKESIEDLAKNQLKEIFATGAKPVATTESHDKLSFFGFTKEEILQDSTKVRALCRIISNDSKPKSSYRKKYSRPNFPKRGIQANKIVKQNCESKEQSKSNVSHTDSGSQGQIPSELTSGIQLNNSQITGISNVESSFHSEEVPDSNQIVSSTDSPEEQISSKSVNDFSNTNHLDQLSVDEQYVPKSTEKKADTKLATPTKMVVDEELPVKMDWENENTETDVSIIVDMEIPQGTEGANANDLFTECSNLSSSKQSLVKTPNDLPMQLDKAKSFNVQNPEEEREITTIQLAGTSKQVESVSAERTASPKLKVGDIIDISSAQLVCTFKPDVSDMIVPNVTLISSCPVTKNEEDLNVSNIQTESRLVSSKEKQSFVKKSFKPKAPVRTFDTSKDNRCYKEKSSSQVDKDSQSDSAFKTLASRITNALGISETEETVKLLKFLLPYINQTALCDELDKQQDKTDSKDDKHEIDAVDFLLSFQDFPETPSLTACEEADEISSSSSESITFEQDDFDREDVTCLNTSNPDLETSSNLYIEEKADETEQNIEQHVEVQLPCDKFLGMSSEHFVDSNLFTKEYDKDTTPAEENESVTPEEIQQQGTEIVDAADQIHSNPIEDSLTEPVAQSPTKLIEKLKEQNTYENKDEIQNIKTENKISIESTNKLIEIESTVAVTKDVSPVITEESAIHNEEAITVPVCTQSEVSVPTTVDTLPVANEHDIDTAEVSAGKTKGIDCNGNDSNKREADVLFSSKKLEELSGNVSSVKNVEPAKKPFRSRKPKVNLIPARRKNIAKKALETSIVGNLKVAEKPNLDEKSIAEQESQPFTSTSELLISQLDKNCSEGLTNGLRRESPVETSMEPKREEDLKTDEPKSPAEDMPICENTAEVTNVESNNLNYSPSKRSATIDEEQPKKMKCDHYDEKVSETDKQQINTPNRTDFLVEESVLKNVDNKVSDTNEQQPENPSEALMAVNEPLDVEDQENHKSQPENKLVMTVIETLGTEDLENYKSIKSITPSSSPARNEDCIEIDNSSIASPEKMLSQVPNVDDSILTENLQIDDSMQGLCSTEEVSAQSKTMEDAEDSTGSKDLAVVPDSVPIENFQIDNSIQGLASTEEASTQSKTLEDAEICTENKDSEVVADSSTIQKSEEGSTEENHKATEICNLECNEEESINYDKVSNCSDSPTTENVSVTSNIKNEMQYSLDLEQTKNDNSITVELDDRNTTQVDTIVEESSERMDTSNLSDKILHIKEEERLENPEAAQRITPDNPEIPCIADNLPSSSKTLRNRENQNDIKVIDCKKDTDQDEDETITIKEAENDASQPKDKKRRICKSAPTSNKPKLAVKTSKPCKRKSTDTENDLAKSSTSAKKIRIFYDVWSDPPVSSEAVQNCDGAKENTLEECSSNLSTEKPHEDGSNALPEQDDFHYFSPLEKLSIDHMHPRLLLVDKIKDLEKPIQDGKKTVSKGCVKCGACKEIVAKQKMNAHIAKHYYVGWIEGTETPVNLSSYREVLNKMIFQMKALKVRSVFCRICGNEKKSAAGMLSHLLVCSETDKIKFKCLLCNSVVQRLTTLSHANGCKALKRTTPVIEENKTKPPEEACTDIIDTSTIDSQISASGRLKRRSVLKAEKKFKEIAEEKFNPEMFIAPYKRPLQGQHFRWNKEIQKSGSVKCAGQNCDFTTKSVDDIKNHEKTCNLVWRSGYRCTGCNKFVAQDRESVVKHVTEVHKADSVPVHVPSDSEEEVIIDESSSSSESTDASFEVASESEQNVRKKLTKKSTGNKTNDSIDNTSQETLHTKILQYTLAAERDIAFSDFNQYVNMTIQFRKCNYYQEHILPQCTANLSPVDEYESYMPTNKLSIKYSYAKDKGWSQMELFKSVKSKDEELIFVGGPVTYLEWVPLPDDYSYKKPQYFVVVSKSNYNQYTKMVNQKKRKLLIQVWEYSCQKRESKFLYSIAYDIGPIHHIAFLPSGGYAPDLNRLGIVAVSSVCSEIRIFALPLKAPQNCDNMNNSVNVVLDVKPFILLRLRYKKCYENRTHDVAECIQMVWSESKGHKYIFGAFSNGFVAIWDIEDKENMNKFIDNGLQIYVPMIYFSASELCITSMQVHYDIKGPRWMLVTTENRDCKIFDLCDINMPTSVNSEEALRSRALRSCWPVYWQNPSILLTEEYTAGAPCIMQKSPSNVLYKCRNNICLSANLNDISFSPWYNTLLTGTDNGDICVRRQYNTLFDLTANRWKRGRYLALTQIKRLDGERIPVLNTKPGAEDAPELLKLFDRDYINKYGIIFKKMVEVPIAAFDKWSSSERNPPYVLRDFVRVSRTSINTNYKTKDLYAVGYENGFIRIRSLAELYK